jgi:hypothetical protein
VKTGRTAVTLLSSVAGYSSDTLNVSGASIGGVEEMSKRDIPAAKTYRLAWVSPRRAGGMVKVRFSFKTAPVSANPPG